MDILSVSLYMSLSIFLFSPLSNGIGFLVLPDVV